MYNKKAKLKTQRSIITVVLSVAALVLLVTSFFINDDETQSLVRAIGFGFILSVIIFRLFRGEFGYKPTREELEENMFGKNK